MNDYKYYSDLDSHPFTGEYNVNFKARIAQNDHVKKFFDGTAGVEQVQNVTIRYQRCRTREAGHYAGVGSGSI